MQRCWVNGEQIVIWVFNPTREALAVIVNAKGTLEEPGPWVQTRSCPDVLKLTDYYLICRAQGKDIALVPDTERLSMSSPRRTDDTGLIRHLEKISQMSASEVRKCCSLLCKVLEQHGYDVVESSIELRDSANHAERSSASQSTTWRNATAVT